MTGREHLSMAEARAALRGHADRYHRLVDTAHSVVRGALPAADILAVAREK